MMKCPRVRLPGETGKSGTDAELEVALQIALQAHSGVKDRYGEPMILHPLRVMARMSTHAERTAAILHDVVEDSGWTPARLIEAGISRRIAGAVDRLSRRRDESYETYIERLSGDELAVRVKLADLEDKMDDQRMDRMDESEGRRLERYRAAWKKLSASRS